MRKSTILRRKTIEDFNKRIDLEERMKEVLKIHEIDEKINGKIIDLEMRILSLEEYKEENKVKLQRAKEKKYEIAKIRDNIEKINMIIIKYDFDIKDAQMKEKNILYILKLIPLGEKTRFIEVKYSIKSQTNCSNMIGNNEVFSIIELNEEKTASEINANHKCEIMK